MITHGKSLPFDRKTPGPWQEDVGMKMMFGIKYSSPIFMPKAISPRSTDYRFETPFAKSIS
jgi:hypothetical protein